MNEPPSLPSTEPAPRATDSLFFAVQPDAPAIARIEALLPDLRSRHGLRGKAMEPQRLHVTLHHLGNHAGVPEALLALAGEAAQQVRRQPFMLSFDRVESFFKPRNSPLVLRGDDGLAGVTALQAALADAMRAVGLGARVQQRFTPHLTLMYDDQRVRAEAIEPIAWSVREFVLLRSLLGQRTYVPLARWPLRG